MDMVRQGVPEFVTRTEKTHLRMNAMSRSRSSEKVWHTPLFATFKERCSSVREAASRI